MTSAEDQTESPAVNFFDSVNDLIEDLVAAARLLHAAFVDSSGIGAPAGHIRALEKASNTSWLASFLRQSAEELPGCMDGIRSRNDISKRVQAVAGMEDAADEVYRTALAALLILGADPIQAVRWKDIYDRLEETIDRCAEVARFLAA